MKKKDTFQSLGDVTSRFLGAPVDGEHRLPPGISWLRDYRFPESPRSKPDYQLTDPRLPGFRVAIRAVDATGDPEPQDIYEASLEQFRMPHPGKGKGGPDWKHRRGPPVRPVRDWYEAGWFSVFTEDLPELMIEAVIVLDRKARGLPLHDPTPPRFPSADDDSLSDDIV